MKKVVVERPRWGSRQRNRKFGTRLKYVPDHDYDEQPKKPRGFESHNGNRKHFTDVLGPLRGFLRKNVGRPWDKIYSELCSSLDKRKVTGNHVFGHLKDMVQTNCFIGSSGKVCYRDFVGDECEVDYLYVHPRSGLLCCPKQLSKRESKRRRLLAQDVSLLLLDSSTGYRKHNGEWYRVKLRHMAVPWFPPGEDTTYDIFLKETVRLRPGEYWIATEKKQCNRDELKDVQRLLAERKQKIMEM